MLGDVGFFLWRWGRHDARFARAKRIRTHAVVNEDINKKIIRCHLARAPSSAARYDTGHSGS
jgi:hypothetical protein